MAQRESDSLLSRSYICHFSPKKIAGLITAQITSFSSLILILLNRQWISIDIQRRTERIISIHIDMRVIVFPIHIVCRVPVIRLFIKRMLDISPSISGILQCSWIGTFIINDIHSHYISVGKSVVIYPTYIKLINFSGERNRCFGACSICSKLFITATTP